MPASELLPLCNNETYSDVSFIVGSSRSIFYGVRSLLAVGSLFFDTLLFPPSIDNNTTAAPVPQNNIEIPDVDPELFLAMMQFIYTGEVTITASNVNGLIMCSRRFIVPKLEEACENFFEKETNDLNALELWEQAEKLGLKKLAEKSIKYICKRGKQFFVESDAYLKLNKHMLMQLLARDDLRVKEMNVFTAVQKWAAEEFSRSSTSMSTMEIIRELLPSIRFAAISGKDLINVVFPTNILNEDEQLELLKQKVLSDDKPVNPRKSYDYTFDIFEKTISYQTLLNDGWKVVYSYVMNHSTTNDELKNLAKTIAHDDVLFCCAAKKRVSDEISLCAFGLAKNVLQVQGSTSAAIKHGNVYWYFVESQSFGFADAANISLGSADTVAGDKRMSWHLSGGGGYRVGESRGLNDDTEFEKLLLFLE